MFREMRRTKQYLPEEECIDILKNGTSGVLAVSGDDDYSYAVPLSYAYNDGKLYFHCALVGHKIDAIKKNNKVSFCVIGQDKIIPEEFTTYFNSVIAFGRARMVEDNDEKIAILKILSDKYSPGLEKEADEEIAALLDKTGVLEITIEHMTGKEGKYLAEQRRKA